MRYNTGLPDEPGNLQQALHAQERCLQRCRGLEAGGAEPPIERARATWQWRPSNGSYGVRQHAQSAERQ